MINDIANIVIRTAAAVLKEKHGDILTQEQLNSFQWKVAMAAWQALEGMEMQDLLRINPVLPGAAYDWQDKRIPQNCNWLATNENGITHAFISEPFKSQQLGGMWVELLFDAEVDARGARQGQETLGTFCFYSPHSIGKKEQRTLSD